MFKVPLEVEQKVVINKKPHEVFDFMADFNNWPAWSPWLILESACKFQVTGAPKTVGHGQEWEGQVIGSGRMTITSVSAPSEVQMNIEFLKPWKSQSKVGFELRPVGDATEVAWTMQGELPFVMFFFRKMMKAWIGNDYSRGLRMLKEKLETGTVRSKVDVLGVKDLDGFYFVGIEREVSMAQLSSAMKEDYAYLGKQVSEGKLPPPQGALDFTDKYDMVSGICKYRACLSFKTPVQTSDPKLKAGEVKAHKGLSVLHTGAYDHLGNAWGAAMAHQRAKKLKRDKNVAMYEVYLNMPDQTKPEDLRTQVVIPLKNIPRENMNTIKQQ